MKIWKQFDKIYVQLKQLKLNWRVGDADSNSTRSIMLEELLSATLRSNAADYVLRRLIFYRQPCVATQSIMFYVGLFLFFSFFLFTLRSQLLLDRFTQNFQELCILV